MRGAAEWRPPVLYELLERHQPDQRLGVLTAGDRNIELGERELDDLDPLAWRRPSRDVVELGSQEEPDALVGEPGAGVEALQLPPVARGLADLLDQLALGALERRLA